MESCNNTVGGIITKNLFAQIKSKIKRNESANNSAGYKDLAPLDNISDGSTYLEALDWAINNPRVQNIALTGPYGSGKSSVIQSFLKSHSGLKTINVSLAAFQENSQEEKNPSRSDSDVIEEGILKQLFYRVDHKDIPQSRYRKLHRIGHLGPMAGIGAIELVLVLFAYGFLPAKFAEVYDLLVQAGSRFCLNSIWSIIVTIAFMIIFDYIIADLFRSLRGKIKLKEVKLPANATIAAENDGDNSVFNRNLDEIVYYFEEMKYDVVFFEDLDRLNNAEIFVKLRELNILLNNDEAIKKPVKFVYAVRDDIFSDKDRTKFFEFIIPVVPVINSTNSGEILAQLINDGPVKTDISTEYILDISPFVSDMRLLQNAFNEFLIYKNTLQSGQSLNLEDQAMLSLVIFKNLYPREFADLQAEKGVVKQAFLDKTKVIGEIRQTIQDEIDEASRLLEGLNNDRLKNRRELVASFFCAVTNWQGYAYQITINGRSYRFDDFLNTEFDFDQIPLTGRTNEQVYYSYHTFSGSGGYSNNSSVPKEVFESYAKRFKSLVLADDNRAVALRKEIEDRQQHLYSIGGASLKRLIEEYGVEQVLSENVRAIPPLVYMLRMGYIDERYADYINYFKGTSITTADMNFILSVKNHESQPFNYELTKVDQVVSRLQPYEFEQEEIRNFDLLEYLLGNDAHREKLFRLIKRITDGSASSWQFLDEFAEKTSHVPELFHNISAAWPELWDYIFKNVVLTNAKKNHYLARILNYADLTDIVALNTNGNISACFVENPKIFEALSEVPAEKMVSVIDALELQFVDVELKNAGATIADHIIDGACYKICISMIQRVTEYIDSSLLQDLETKNFTTLLRMNSRSVLTHVYDNWDTYINEIILANGNTEEEGSAVIKLLEKTLHDTDVCVRVISHLNFTIDSLEDCSFADLLKDRKNVTPLWNQLINEDKILPTWDNVTLYWKQFALTEELTAFVERNAQKLADDDSRYVEEGFIRQYLCSNGNDDSYRLLTRTLKLEQFDLPIANIPENRVAVLIDNRYFDFDIDIYTQIRSAYSGLSIRSILANQSECIALANSMEMDSATLSGLIQSDSASEELKEHLLKTFGERYMSEELALELCIHHYAIERTVFWSAWNYLNEVQRQELMYNYLSALKADDFERCFADIDEFTGMRDRVRHNVDLVDNENNRSLAKRLEAVDYITSWKPESREHRITCGKETRTEYHKVIVCIVKALR